MPTDYRFKAFNTPAARRKSGLLPFRWSQQSRLCTCSNCSFVNLTTHNYCTNCGFPLLPNNDRLNLYHHRLKIRKDLLQRSEETIQFARNTLYIMGALCFLGVVVLLMESRPFFLSALILSVVAIMFIGLGRWSLARPFTSLLISFLVVITLIAINTWAEFIKLFTSSYGMYILMVQVVCFIFLMRGLQAAYRADIMEDEFKI